MPAAAGVPGLGSVALALTAAASWGGADFAGGLAARRASPFATVAIAHGMSLVVLGTLALWLQIPAPSAHTGILGAWSGLIGGLALVLLYEALALGKMGLSAAIAGLLTAAIPVGFSFFTEGLPRPIQIAGFSLAALAIWLIASVPGEKAHPRALGRAALAGIGFGIFFILLKLAGRGGVVWPLLYARLASFALTTSIYAASVFLRRKSSQPRDEASQTSHAAGRVSRSPWAPIFLLLVAVSCVFDTGGNLLYTMATRAGRLDIAAVLSSLYPAGTILLAALLLKERTTGAQAVGMALALGAVVLIAL